MNGEGTIMNTEKLRAAARFFAEHQRTNSAYYLENWKERQERRTFYQAYTRERIMRMDADEFYEYISK